MAVLVWLLIPLAAAVGAAVWSVWAARKPSSVGDVAGVAGYEAFRAAMERSSSRSGGHGGPARATASAMAHAAPDGRTRAAD